MAKSAAMALMGLGIGFLSSLVAGCEANDADEDCACHPARVGATTLGEPTTNEGDFPSLEGAWLKVNSLEADQYDPEAPAAVLEYFDGGELVRVKFAGFVPGDGGENGGAGGVETAP
jgi:hypothetical protein